MVYLRYEKGDEQGGEESRKMIRKILCIDIVHPLFNIFHFEQRLITSMVEMYNLMIFSFLEIIQILNLGEIERY